MKRTSIPVLWLGCAGSLLAQSFSATNHPVGFQPDEVVFGDVDLDGDLDFVVAVSNPVNGVSIWRNDGSGNFTQTQNVFIGSQSRSLVLEDLDGDGDLDLAVATGAGQVVVRANLGTGTFGPATAFPVGSNPRGLSIGDFNNDLRRDLAVANRDGNSVSVLINTGGLSFTTTALPVGIEPRNVVVADLNRDGADDLVVANHDSRDVSVRLSNGNGTFGPDVRLPVGSSFRAEWVTASDVDNDADLDIVVALGETVGRVGVFANNGNGTFGGQQISFVNGQEPGTVAAMDFDGDRDADLVTANEDSNDVSVLVNNGGSFAAAAVIPTGLYPESLCGGDIDGDGDMDFAVVNRDSGTVTVLRNTTPGAATNATMRAGGPAASGLSTTLQLSSPQDSGMFYIAVLSTAAGPAIPLGDGRFLPIGPSDLISITLGFNTVLVDSLGILDGSGHAYPRLVLPNVPQLSGFTFHGTFAVLDAGHPLTLGTIADPLALPIQ